MEDAVGAGGYGLVAEHPARADDPDGRLAGLHSPYLHRTGVGAEQYRIDSGGDEECVLHISGRMIRREVEGLEDVMVVLYLGAFCQGIALLAEDGYDLLAGNGYRVTGSQLEMVSGHGHVE